MEIDASLTVVMLPPALVNSQNRFATKDTVVSSTPIYATQILMRSTVESATVL